MSRILALIHTFLAPELVIYKLLSIDGQLICVKE